VRLADTVQLAAALNDLISLAALDMLGWQTVVAPMPAAVETVFVPSIRRAYLDSQALDFAGGWCLPKWSDHQASIVLLGRNKLGKPQNIND